MICGQGSSATDLFGLDIDQAELVVRMPPVREVVGHAEIF